MSPSPELLAPAGDWDCLRAAVANGADAVYFGLPRFNARLRAHNFTEEELPEVVAFCHRFGVKAYVAFNTLVFTGELDAAADYLRLLNSAGVDALIVQDVGLIRLAAQITPQLPIHASTQMTITSPEGVEFAEALGIERVVLARELSLRELEKFQTAREQGSGQLPLEVFVHGALCVAYSGQCLTSESLGQRSANRGECAQACRMPYELIVDGALRDLGDRKYLLSPQDLAAVNEIPRLLELGVVSFKIEGRLKAPEYVAAVCQVYRKAIDAAIEQRPHQPSPAERYQLEMTFSRGLYNGWFNGVNHQELVPARYAKKRGPFAGRITAIGRDFVEIDPLVPLAPGDGIVFDTGGDTNTEQGGRIFEIKGKRLFFQHRLLDFSKLKPGDRVWKTSDPALEKRLAQSFSGKLSARRRQPIDLRVSGSAGQPLVIEASFPSPSGPQSPQSPPSPPAASPTLLRSTILLEAARNAPLGEAKLREHLGRFGDSVYELAGLTIALEGEVILPIGELNRLRRELIYQLDAAQKITRPQTTQPWREVLGERQPVPPVSPVPPSPGEPQLTVLCRSIEQLQAALDCGVATLYADFEDIRRYKDAVALVRTHPASTIFLATPRIQKAGEGGFFKLIDNAAPDGVLIRNLGAIAYFQQTALRKIGDFSLNVANPITAGHFLAQGLERVTISYDLNVEQVLDLLADAPAARLELTLHQHMPMFHMEHCVFAAFLSKGTSYLDCGRPCDTHRVHLRDRVGMEHPLRADVGCRNTLFNAVAQSGARFYSALRNAGLAHFRVELLEESAADTRKALLAYQQLLAGTHDGEQLWRTLRAQSQLGVTRGTL